MSLLARLQEDMKQAMRQQEKDKVTAIRMVIAEIRKQEIDTRTSLNDEQSLAVLTKLIKQRKESCEIYKKANREDLAQKEQFEINVLQLYLPAQLSEAELQALINEALQVSGAASIKDLGKVMALLKPKVAGRVDMSSLSDKIKAAFPA